MLAPQKLGWPGKESSFSASKTSVGHLIFCAISFIVQYFDFVISSKGVLTPAVDIPCFILNLILLSKSISMVITVLTTSALPSSTARAIWEDLKKGHHSHHIHRTSYKKEDNKIIRRLQQSDLEIIHQK